VLLPITEGPQACDVPPSAVWLAKHSLEAQVEAEDSSLLALNAAENQCFFEILQVGASDHDAHQSLTWSRAELDGLRADSSRVVAKLSHQNTIALSPRIMAPVKSGQYIVRAVVEGVVPSFDSPADSCHYQIFSPPLALCNVLFGAAHKIFVHQPVQRKSLHHSVCMQQDEGSMATNSSINWPQQIHDRNLDDHPSSQSDCEDSGKPVVINENNRFILEEHSEIRVVDKWNNVCLGVSQPIALSFRVVKQSLIEGGEQHDGVVGDVCANVLPELVSIPAMSVANSSHEHAAAACLTQGVSVTCDGMCPTGWYVLEVHGYGVGSSNSRGPALVPARVPFLFINTLMVGALKEKLLALNQSKSTAMQTQRKVTSEMKAAAKIEAQVRHKLARTKKTMSAAREKENTAWAQLKEVITV
jgi:hypothetical protein